MDRAERISASFASDPYADSMGFRLAASDPVVVTLAVAERHTNFLGGTHGGVVFSLADCAFSLASNAAGDRAVAIDTHLVLTAGTGVGDVLTATAEETTRGRTLGTYRVIVTREDGRRVGLFTGTVHITPSI